MLRKVQTTHHDLHGLLSIGRDVARDAAGHVAHDEVGSAGAAPACPERGRNLGLGRGLEEVALDEVHAGERVHGEEVDCDDRQALGLAPFAPSAGRRRRGRATISWTLGLEEDLGPGSGRRAEVDDGPSRAFDEAVDLEDLEELEGGSGSEGPPSEDVRISRLAARGGRVSGGRVGSGGGRAKRAYRASQRLDDLEVADR